MHRRAFLRALTTVSLSALPLASWSVFFPRQGMGAGLIPQTPQNTQYGQLPQERQYDRYVDHIPAIPILAFYRVHDTPRFPEDISSTQLANLFSYVWSQGYRPVNISDILLNRIDSVVPAGFKPLGITSDAAHASMIFSTNTAPKGGDKGPLQNAQSFVEIFAASLQNIAMPRATFFLSIPKGKKNNSYFGSIMPLKDIADVMQVMPHVEFGYQTKWYTPLGALKGDQVRTLLEVQMEDFQKMGMLERIPRIISYPFGGKPNDEGMLALRDLKFLGGVLTYPGVGEAHHETVPQCLYDGRLLTNAFLLPRVAVGSHVYAPGNKPAKNPPIEPIDDFKKDVGRGVPNPYVSKGK